MKTTDPYHKIHPDQLQEQAHNHTEQHVIKPVTVDTTESLKTQQPDIDVPAGHVLIVVLNSDGTEIPGSEFFYPERSYKRFYADEGKYRIKKKVN